MGAFDDLIPGSDDPFADLTPVKPGFKPGDYIKAVTRGIQQVPGSLTGLADVPGALILGDRYAGKAADKLGDLTGFKPGQWAKETSFSPGAQAEMQDLSDAWSKSGADRLGNALLTNHDDLPEAWRQADLTSVGKAIVRNPGAAAANVLESVPSMLVGGAIGKGLAVAGKLAPVVAGALGEGAIAAGQNMDQTDTNVDPRKAAGSALAAGSVDALIAGAGGKLAKRMGIADVQTSLAGGHADNVGHGALARIGGGALSEGLVQELPQSMQEQAWQNYAEDKPLGEGVIRQGVEGAIAGGVMGGGANVRAPAVVPRADGQGDVVIDPATGPLSAAAAEHVHRTDAQAAEAATGDLFGDLTDPLVSAPETADEPLSPLHAWRQEAEPVSLEEAQAIVQQARDAGYDGHAVIQHGDGFGVVPREWLDADQVKAAEPFQLKAPATVDQAAVRANTAPSKAQIEAGNYQKGHIKVGPLDIAIENPAGSTRTGPGWQTTMQAHYGYMKRTEGADGDQVDVYVKQGTPVDHAGPVFVIDQYDPTTGKFDEHKAMLGYRFQGAAIKAYDAHFSDGSGPTRRKGVTMMSAEQFKQWAQSADAKAPAATPESAPEIVTAGWDGYKSGDQVTTKAGTTGTLHFDDTNTIGYVTPDKLADGNANPDAGKTTPKATGTFSVSPAEVSKATIQDFGEKVGGARKDTAQPTGAKAKTAAPAEVEPGWHKRFTPIQNMLRSEPTWNLIDTKTGKPIRGAEFKSEQAAKDAIPLIAVAQKHRVVSVTGGFEIMRNVTDRKRVKVVDQVFPTRDDAMTYLAKHAQEIIETKTAFREELFARPEKVMRDGALRRTGPATAEDFSKTFGFRGVEFGNWNSQDERQEVMNHAFDGLLDLADVLGVPPKALSLNGDLALAFGARGQGLSGAVARYERNYGVINLTKMQGAGALAHEWMHAADHYFGRQDGKASSQKVQNKRGDMVFETDGPSDYASHGLSYAKSGMREELRAKYKALIQTLFTKAEQYVEDTAQAEKFVGSARDTLVKSLTAMRKQLEKAPEWMKRFNKPATAEQLAEFDRLAAEIIDGKAFGLETRAGAKRWNSIRLSNDTLDALSDLYKAVRGRAGMNAERTGVVDGIRGDMRRYAERVKMLNDARNGSEKTKAVPTRYAMDAKRIDQGSATDYWTTPHEMAARAFSAYVEDKLPGKSDFLSYGSNNAMPEYRIFNVRPFPEGAERQAINQAFDEFVGALQTRETEKGIELFSELDRDQRVAAFNRAANAQIQQWAAGELKSNAIIELGRPSSVLLKFGMPDLPMHLTQAVLRKAVKEKHDVDVADLKDIAVNVQAPIAVFGSKRGPGHVVVVTEARHADGNIIVALDLDVQRDGIGINDVRSIHPKRDSSVTRWLEDGLLLGVEKRKGRDWLENSVGSNSQQPQVKAALDRATIYDTDSIRNQRVTADKSTFDQTLFTAVRHGADLAGVLNFIGSHSASPFNRELARMLQSQGLKTTIQTTDGHVEAAGSYDPESDRVRLHAPEKAEQVILHELMHAATVKALTGKSVASGAMRALMKRVRQELGIDSHYGLKTVYEFVAEAFTNPDFQQALKGIKVSTGIRGKLTDAWQRFVSTVRQLLGLGVQDETALGRAIELGVRLIEENKTATYQHPLGILNSQSTDPDKLTVRDWIGHNLANQRSWAIGALTRDQLADIYGKEMPEVADFDRVVQQMDQARNIVAEQADAIIERWRKLPAKTADALAGIMHAATLEQFDPDIKTRDDVATPEQSILLKDWAALPEEAKQLYRDVRDQYAATLAKLRNGLSKRAERAGAAGQRIAAQIRLQFDKYLAEGPYFPLARFGDFILIADKHEQRIVEAFESSAAREKRARQLRITGWKTKLTAKKGYSATKDGPAGEFVGDVLKLVDGLEIEAKEKASLMDSLNQLAIGALPDQSYRRHFAHRKGTAGFSQDAMRAFASSMQHVAHHVARVLHGDELTLLLDSMNKRISETTGDVDTTTQQQVANELGKRLDLMMNPTTHPVTALAGQVGFVMSLGGSVASGLTNLSQTPLITFPWLGARFGFDKAAGALTKASKDYFGGRWDKWSGYVLKDNQALTAGERRALQQLEDAGLINLTQTSDLASTATTDSASSQRSWAINRAMKIIGWTFSVPEVFNRQVSALAAYRLATEKGETHDQAVETALETLRRTHFDYSASNRSRWMAGNFTRVITMFKQYSQQMTYLLWRNAYQALKGESQAVRREARRMLIGVAAMHFAAAGALGLPLGVFGLSPLLAMLSMGMGSGDDPWDWEVEFRKLLADTFGKVGGEAIAHGPLRMLTNVDFASRVGLGDLWVRSPQGDKEGRDLVEAWMLTLLGPVAGYIGNLGTAAKAFDEGKVGRGLEAMLPKMLAAPLKAVRYETEGVKSWRGDDLGVALSGGDILGTALGFNPTRVSEMHEGQRAIKNRESALVGRREEIMNMFNAAVMAGDTEMQAEAMEAAAKFSMTNPGMAINGMALRHSLQAKLRNQAMIKDGVYLQKRRQELRAEGRFANVEGEK